MAFLTMKPKHLRNTGLRILFLGALLLAARFVLFLSLTRDETLCSFPDNNSHDFFSGCVPPDPRFSDRGLRRQRSIDYYTAVFQDLISEGILTYDSKSLCVGTVTGEDFSLTALKEVGVSSSVSPAHRRPYDSDAFDFEFAAEGRLERAASPAELASEVGRTLKPGGFFVAHTWSARDSYSLNSLLHLFDCCRLISVSEIDGLDSSMAPVHEIVMRKDRVLIPGSGGDRNNCAESGAKREITLNAEVLIEQEALKKPWIGTRRRAEKKSVKYLTSMVDISFKQRYVYIDVGARNYNYSIGDWFVREYPKQDKNFEIFAVEYDKSFHSEYRARKEVILLPMAAWIRNETLFFEIAREPNKKKKKKKKKKKRRKDMGNFQSVVPTASYVIDGDEIRGFDFSEWLKRSVSERDFVVVKMDIEGTEFYLIPRMVETGAICLVDEIFLECHYDRIKRRVKYRRTYEECLRLFGLIRERGVLVHQWW